jgi:hypothetical protein
LGLGSNWLLFRKRSPGVALHSNGLGANKDISETSGKRTPKARKRKAEALISAAKVVFKTVLVPCLDQDLQRHRLDLCPAWQPAVDDLNAPCKAEIVVSVLSARFRDV